MSKRSTFPWLAAALCVAPACSESGDSPGTVPDGGGGDATADAFSADAGRDVAIGDAGTDVAMGDAGTDVATGDADADVGTGDAARDVVTVEAGMDVATGDAGRDVATSDAGADVGMGDAGADAATCVPIAPRAISDTVIMSGPRLAFNGSGYGVVWADPRDRSDAGVDGGSADDELYFARLDAQGVRIGSDVRVTNAPGNIAGAAIAWDGTGYEVAFNDTRPAFALFSTRLDANGSKQFDEVNIAALGTPPSLAMSGTSVGLTWSAATVQFARKQQGQSFGSPAMIATGVNPALAPAGAGWGVAFHSDKVYFAFLDAQGTKTSSDLPVSTGAGYRAAIAAGSNGFGVAWGTTIAGDDLVFARLDSAGARIGNEIPLSSGAPSDGLPVVAAGRGGYAVAWVASDARLLLRFIDATGTASGPMMVSTTAFSGGPRPLDIVANGEAFTLVWTDTREGQGKPYVTSICP